MKTTPSEQAGRLEDLRASEVRRIEQFLENTCLERGIIPDPHLTSNNPLLRALLRDSAALGSAVSSLLFYCETALGPGAYQSTYQRLRDELLELLQVPEE